MFDSDKKEFSEILRATMGVYRVDAGPLVLELWWAVLNKYSMEQVNDGFNRFISSKDSKFPPVPAHIVDAIEANCPDGRPGVEEAWSMMPRDEYTSVVMTNEMAEAMATAQSLLNEGDKIAARMAFKEAYTRIVDNNKRQGLLPQWFPSLGSDKEGREAVLNAAIRLGRISVEHAAGLLGPAQAVAILESNNKTLGIEQKKLSPEQVKANLAKLKALLAKSNIGGDKNETT
jgi:hypothetical protein